MKLSFTDRLQTWAAEQSVPLEILSETTSTNTMARAKDYPGGAIVLAEAQTAGRGQRGNRWYSAPGENLTFSVILRPTFLPPEKQFYLSKIVCLALADALEAQGIDAQIKWPNDIYVGGRKMAGILIEHDLSGAELSRTIAGIGLNINQRIFPPGLPNPTSLALEAGHRCDRAEVLITFYGHLARWYGCLGEGGWETIDRQYLRRLYLLGEESDFTTGSNRVPFRGTITGVCPGGELEIRHSSDGRVCRYLFKEIEFSTTSSR